MAYYTDGEVRRAARSGEFSVDARTTLSRDASASRSRATYNIFLSHASLDAEQILGVKRILERRGRTVYVDWIDDPQLDRSRVSASTADLLRRRMRASASFVFATSENSPNSKWMPWELGYFDGLRRDKIAVFPLVAAASDMFRGQEYLALYPTMERLDSTTSPVVLHRTDRRLATLASFASIGRTEFSTF